MALPPPAGTRCRPAAKVIARIAPLLDIRAALRPAQGRSVDAGQASKPKGAVKASLPMRSELPMKLADLPLDDARSTALRGIEIAGIAADSRKVKPGFLFVAIAGAKADGAHFAKQAVAAGAVAVAAEQRPGRAAGHRRLRAGRAMRAARWRWPRRNSFPRQPATIAAVTGTSGKTSVAAFTRQIWTALGLQAASIGTIGVVSPQGEKYGSLTTPDPVELHRTLDQLAGEGVTHLALEASSHGLDQHRLDGVRIAAGAFTNLSRDHLDYHPTIEDYLAAKLRLFTDLVAPNGTAVIDVDDCYAGQVIEAAKTARPQGDDGRRARRRHQARRRRHRRLRASRRHRARRQDLQSEAAAGRRLPGAECGGRRRLGDRDRRRAGARLRRAGAPHRRQGAAGAGRRQERRADLHRLRAQARRAGESARSAAPLRQRQAHRWCSAPAATATRASARSWAASRRRMPTASSSPTTIRAASSRPRSAPPSSPPRRARPRSATAREAIRAGIAALQAGDVLLIAGKGHETGQIVGDRVLPFSDHDAVAAALAGKGGMSALWTIDDMAAAMRADKSGALPADVPGLSIDTRSIAKGEAFFAIKGDNRDGHDFVEAALKAGAGLAVVARDKRARFAADAPLLIVADVLEALRDLARAARARSHAKVIAVTGSVGKTTHQGGAAARARRRRRDACLGRLLQQSLGRAAVARAPAGEREIRGVRDRHEPCRRDHAADQTGAPACGDRHHRSRRCIWNISARWRRSPTPRRKSFRASSRAAPPCSTATTASIAQLAKAAAKAAGVARIVSFGEHAQGRCAAAAPFAAGRMLDRRGAHPRPAGHLQARRAGHASGAQFARRAGGRRAGRRRSGAGGAGARQAQAGRRPRRARHLARARRQRAADRRELQRQSGLHGGGDRAARPGAARPARPPHRRAWATCWSWARKAPALHRGLAEPIEAAGSRSGVLQRAADARALGGPSLRAAGAAMPRPRRRWSRPCSPPSATATR